MTMASRTFDVGHCQRWSFNRVIAKLIDVVDIVAKPFDSKVESIAGPAQYGAIPSDTIGWGDDVFLTGSDYE